MPGAVLIFASGWLGGIPAAAQDITAHINGDYLGKLRQAIVQLEEQRVEREMPGPWRQVRANLHVHSELSHDSHGTIEEIIVAAKSVGTEVLLFTEHPSAEADFFTDGHSGEREGILCIPGAEMKGMLVYPTHSLRDFEQAEAAEITQIVRTREGHVFLSHLEERMDWEIPGLTGIEIYNTHADFKKQKRLMEAMRNPLWFIRMADLVERFPQEFFSILQTYPDDYLGRWDELCQAFPHTGIAANDAHQNVGVRLKLAAGEQVVVEDALGEELLKISRALVRPFMDLPVAGKDGDLLFSLQLDRYENSLRHAGTHLLVSELSQLGVWQALESGRVFVGFDWLANSRSFAAAIVEGDADGGAQRWDLGSQLPWSTKLTMIGQSPLNAKWRLIRNGETVSEATGRDYRQAIDRPGVYRLELWLNVLGEERIWILTNPFYVNPVD